MRLTWSSRWPLTGQSLTSSLHRLPRLPNSAVSPQKPWTLGLTSASCPDWSTCTSTPRSGRSWARAWAKVNCLYQSVQGVVHYARDLPLAEWLMSYTFPLEARCEDLTYAQSVWDAVVTGLLQHGTTTAVYYSTIHEPATLLLAQTCATKGQRAFVGRCAMDHKDLAPEGYRDPSAAEAVAASNASFQVQSPVAPKVPALVLSP
jgi:hypothetical protein